MKNFQMKAKNLFSCHIFETHAYNRARARSIYIQAITLGQAGCKRLHFNMYTREAVSFEKLSESDYKH